MTEALKTSQSLPDLEALCLQLIETCEPVDFECKGQTFGIITQEDFDPFETLELEASSEKPISYIEVCKKLRIRDK